MDLVSCGILLILIIFFYILHVKIADPLMLFIISFFTLFILESFRFYGLYRVSNGTYLIIIIGIISFSFGCYLVKLLPKKNAQKINVSSKVRLISNQIEDLRNLFITLIVLSLIIEILYALPSISYLRGGGNLYDLRYSNQNTLQRIGIISTLHVYFAIPILFIELPISVYSYFIDRKKLLFVLNIIVTFLYFVSDGARMPLVYFILSILSVFILFFKEIKDRGQILKIFLVFVTLILIIDFLSVIRSNGSLNGTFIQGMYYYLTSSMINFEDKLNNINNKSFLFGVATFYGLFSPLSSFVNVPLVNSAKGFFDYIQNATVIVSTQSLKPYNFCVTGFLNTYADGGYLGLVLISLILGVVMENIYIMYCQHKSLKWFIVYSLIMQAIMMFVITDMFSSIAFVMALVYIFLFSSLRKHDYKQG